MRGYYALSRTDDASVMFTLHVEGARIALTSPPFITKADALDFIEMARRFGSGTTGFDRQTSASGDPYFVLETPDGDVIGCSEVFYSTQAMERAIQQVIENARAAAIKDLT